jgi:hypothetical protein
MPQYNIILVSENSSTGVDTRCTALVLPFIIGRGGMLLLPACVFDISPSPAVFDSTVSCLTWLVSTLFAGYIGTNFRLSPSGSSESS